MINTQSSRPSFRTTSQNGRPRRESAPAGLSPRIHENNIQPSDFLLKNQKSLSVNEDWETDDTFFSIGFLPTLSKYYQDKPTPPLMMVISGEANASIQNAKAKRYFETMQQEGLVAENINPHFIQGKTTTKVFSHQGEDCLTDEEIRLCQNTSGKMQLDEYQDFLTENPQGLMFIIKRPDELLELQRQGKLPDISQIRAVMYAGGFNTETDHAEMIQLLNRFHSVMLCQNYAMVINNEERDEKGHLTPRDICFKNTPRFSEALMRSESPTIKNFLKLVRIWNNNILHKFGPKIIEADTSQISDPSLIDLYKKSAETLSDLMPKDKDTIPDDKTLSDMTEALKPLMTAENFKVLKKSLKGVGFRLEAFHNLTQDINTQSVIADQLALFSTVHPEKIASFTKGTPFYNEKGFLDVKPNPCGKVLNLGPIEGKAGYRHNTSLPDPYRIEVIEDFLLSLMPPSSHKRKREEA